MKKLYFHPNCSNCKKALKFVEKQGIDCKLIDLREKPPTKADLSRALLAVDGKIKKLFNVSGKAYREGDYKSQLAGMTDKEAIAELSSEGMLVKRPLLITDSSAYVGFSETDWKKV